jgi:hypothetical protein
VNGRRTPVTGTTEVSGVLEAFAEATSTRSAAQLAYSLHELLCYGSVTVEEPTVPAVRVLYGMVTDAGFRWKHCALQLIDSIACVPRVLDAGSLDATLHARVRAGRLRELRFEGWAAPIGEIERCAEPEVRSERLFRDEYM